MPVAGGGGATQSNSPQRRPTSSPRPSPMPSMPAMAERSDMKAPESVSFASCNTRGRSEQLQHANGGARRGLARRNSWGVRLIVRVYDG